MALTIRLDPRTRRALDTLARQQGQTRSAVVREALVQYTASNVKVVPADGPYEDWIDVIGIVKSHDADSQATTGERFTDLVRQKARARRAR